MKKLTRYLIISALVSTCIITSRCRNTVEIKDEPAVKQLEWTRDAVIYEVNIRQYSPEGTFKAFEKDLPRLKELGVDILWLMPVFPIGELHRKADQSILIEEVEDPLEREKYLGSYYSTKDYLSVNPEFGTIEDFKTLVDKIHKLGMYIILDMAPQIACGIKEEIFEGLEEGLFYFFSGWA